MCTEGIFLLVWGAQMKSRAIGVRISIDNIEKINKRAARKGWTFNKWINWAVSLGLRSHKRNV